MLMQNAMDGTVRDIEPSSIPPHKANLWQLYAPPTPPEPSLAEVKIHAKAYVGEAAERIRHRYITPGSGKAMSYQQVAAEAIRYSATGGAGAYPFLQARVASGRYPDLAAAAAATQQIEAQWASVGARIDEIEDRAKLGIDTATTVAAVEAASRVEWI